MSLHLHAGLFCSFLGLAVVFVCLVVLGSVCGIGIVRAVGDGWSAGPGSIVVLE